VDLVLFGVGIIGQEGLLWRSGFFDESGAQCHKGGPQGLDTLGGKKANARPHSRH